MSACALRGARLEEHRKTLTKTGETEQRDRVCVNEILEDCLNERSLLKQYDRKRVRDVLNKLPHLEKKSSMRFGERFGTQRGWVIKSDGISFF